MKRLIGGSVMARRRFGWFAAITSASLIAGLLTTFANPGTASAAACLPDTKLLNKTPVSSFNLPQGAHVRIWDTGVLARWQDDVRIAVVTIPRGSLTPTIATSPTLSRATPTSAMVRSDPSSVVAINADHFNPAVGGIPNVAQISKGKINKLSAASGNDPWQFGMAVYSDTKSIINATARLAGSVSSSSGAVSLTAVNWQTLKPAGITVYTSAWGTYPHPTGLRTIVVSAGVVVAVKAGKAATVRPKANEQWLTASPGTSAAKYLSGLRLGQLVSVTYRLAGSHVGDPYPHQPIGTPTGFVGVGGFILRAGVNRASCDARSESRRPRSAIAWTRSGDLLVVSVSDPHDRGTRSGGATVHQWANILAKLGAVDGVNLDGGTSTTLWVRRSIGGALIRLDQATSSSERPVVNAFSFRAA
jgi:hypothetical protein